MSTPTAPSPLPAPAGNTGRTTMALTETADVADDIDAILRRHTNQQ